MKIEPLAKYSPKPFGVLFPGHRSLELHSADGQRVVYGKRACEDLLATLADWCLYVPDALIPLIHTTGALSWRSELWKNRVTRMIHIPSGSTVSSLRGTVEGPEVYESLEIVLHWLKAYGVSPASLPSMAWQLFRASLPRPYTVGFDPEVGRAAFYGGRQEITNAGVYNQLQLVDIAQAYPTAMARPEGYALSLMEVDSTTQLDSSAAGIARAKVYVPESLPYAPLPVRVDEAVITFQHGFIEGTWSWCELAAAQFLGCEVSVQQSWAPQRQAELFGPWWPLVQEGRALPGGAGAIAKAISNSTWGQFGMRAEGRATQSWADEKGTVPVTVPQEDHEMPHSWAAHIAAETTARVRTQMLLEGLYGGSDPVHIDTDGMIISATSQAPKNSGDQPGQWRVKADIEQLDLRGPQLYRWTCPGCGIYHDHWHFNASGIPAEDAPGYFTGEKKQIHIQHTVRFD